MGLRITAILPLLACVGLSCQLENKKRDEPSAAAAQSTPALAEAPSHQSAIPLDIWPSNTEMMAGLDVSAIKESPLGHVFNGMIRGESLGLLPTNTACQKRLMDSIDHMLFIQGFEDAKSKSVTVIRGVKRSDVEECVAADSTGAAKEYGANYGALDKDFKKYLIWWLDSETFILSPDGGKEQIDLARPKKLRPPTNADLLKSIAKVDTSAAVWIAAIDSPTGMSESVGDFRGSIHLKETLNASFRVNYDSAGSASTAAKDVKSNLAGLTPFGKYFEESRIRAEGSLLMFDLSLSKTRVAELARDPIFQGMFPAPQIPTQ